MRLQDFHPWKISKASWMKSWVNPQLALLHTGSWSRTPRDPFQAILPTHECACAAPNGSAPTKQSVALRSQFLLGAGGQHCSLTETQNISLSAAGEGSARL